MIMPSCLEEERKARPQHEMPASTGEPRSGCCGLGPAAPGRAPQLRAGSRSPGPVPGAPGRAMQLRAGLRSPGPVPAAPGRALQLRAGCRFPQPRAGLRSSGLAPAALAGPAVPGWPRAGGSVTETGGEQGRRVRG